MGRDVPGHLLANYSRGSPIYLQRHLAQLLFEYRAGLTTALLHDPAALGTRLAARTDGYTERFRVFCQNRTLLGQVAAALLLGEDDEESPYLLAPTLQRLVTGLEAEQQSRLWLQDARRFASRVRASGFRPKPTPIGSRERSERLPNLADPKLSLRREGVGWVAYAALPDLTPLQDRLPHLFDEVRVLRASVNGYAGWLSTGRLSYAGQEVRLSAWPAAVCHLFSLSGDRLNPTRCSQDRASSALGRGGCSVFAPAVLPCRSKAASCALVMPTV